MVSNDTNQPDNPRIVLLSEKPLFELGEMLMTPGVDEAIDMASRIYALTQHSSGNWGNVCSEDKQANDEALKSGRRILSSFSSDDGVTFWVITEADRSATTLLLPSEY